MGGWAIDRHHDDATSDIYSALFVEEEGTRREVIAEKGLFCSLYADRGSHYWQGGAA